MPVDKIIRYENGELDEAETTALFQELVNSGLVWKLQGSYTRMAAHLIALGRVKHPPCNTAPWE